MNAYGWLAYLVLLVAALPASTGLGAYHMLVHGRRHCLPDTDTHETRQHKQLSIQFDRIVTIINHSFDQSMSIMYSSVSSCARESV